MVKKAWPDEEAAPSCGNELCSAVAAGDVGRVRECLHSRHVLETVVLRDPWRGWSFEQNPICLAIIQDKLEVLRALLDGANYIDATCSHHARFLDHVKCFGNASSYLDCNAVLCLALKHMASRELVEFLVQDPLCHDITFLDSDGSHGSSELACKRHWKCQCVSLAVWNDDSDVVEFLFEKQEFPVEYLSTDHIYHWYGRVRANPGNTSDECEDFWSNEAPHLRWHPAFVAAARHNLAILQLLRHHCCRQGVHVKPKALIQAQVVAMLNSAKGCDVVDFISDWLEGVRHHAGSGFSVSDAGILAVACIVLNEAGVLKRVLSWGLNCLDASAEFTVREETANAFGWPPVSEIPQFSVKNPTTWSWEDLQSIGMCSFDERSQRERAPYGMKIYTLIGLAVSCNHLDIVELLITSSADIKARVYTEVGKEDKGRLVNNLVSEAASLSIETLISYRESELEQERSVLCDEVKNAIRMADFESILAYVCKVEKLWSNTPTLEMHEVLDFAMVASSCHRYDCFQYFAEYLVKQLLKSRIGGGGCCRSLPRCVLKEQAEAYRGIFVSAAQHNQCEVINLLIYCDDAKLWKYVDSPGLPFKFPIRDDICIFQGSRNSFHMLLDEETLESAAEEAGASGHAELALALNTVHPAVEENSKIGEYVLVDSVSAYKAAMVALRNERVVAVDVEGVGLCRSGSISLVQVCSSSGFVFLFDITTLKDDAFCDDLWGGFSLRTVLEGRTKKLMFDARADADALKHLYGVKLTNVFCLQVACTLRYGDRRDRYLQGWEKYLQRAKVLSTSQLQKALKVKHRGKNLFIRSPEVWDGRPLCEDLIMYAVTDVCYLSRMKEKVVGEVEKPGWESRCGTFHLDFYFSLDERKVERICEARLKKASGGHQAATGNHMAQMDIPHYGRKWDDTDEAHAQSLSRDCKPYSLAAYERHRAMTKEHFEKVLRQNAKRERRHNRGDYSSGSDRDDYVTNSHDVMDWDSDTGEIFG